MRYNIIEDENEKFIKAGSSNNLNNDEKSDIKSEIFSENEKNLLSNLHKKDNLDDLSRPKDKDNDSIIEILIDKCKIKNKKKF